MQGKFVAEWTNVFNSSGKDIKEIDVAAGLSSLLAVKDSEELVRPASTFSAGHSTDARRATAKRAQRRDDDEQADEPL